MFSGADKASPEECPKGCQCEGSHALRCENMELTRIPPNWPTYFETISLMNITSLNTLEKNAFRRYQNLQELSIERCPDLDVIDKYAFKGLRKLRFIAIKENPKLKELYKASFSGIGNEHAMKIHIQKNALERIRGLTFKNTNNLRELLVEDRCFEVDSFAFSAISKVDFLTIKGACSIEEKAFQNTSRVHNLNVFESSLDIKGKTFAELNHVNQIHIRDNRIGRIEEEAFAGLYTVGNAHFQSNQIGRILPRAFANAENLGTLMLSYNTVREPLESPECLINGAQKFVFTENTLHCSCDMRWIQFYQDQTLLSENYCGREEAFKALTYYKPIGCPPLAMGARMEEYQQLAVEFSSPPSVSSPPMLQEADFSQQIFNEPNTGTRAALIPVGSLYSAICLFFSIYT
ncbi:leucine rich repeats (6 copies) domain-containing protein [Ditylenchus destructor]|uniref:Leucine rich repeats (6 copies) domain-containing protein n=1 Tax=Ditylenchus destructor TaxID=166010 RepID=A0AAD4NLY6_9BILA|nr:leucine rich repeats (6 copies) domain-containing protein [Ditylenchus destructor]